MSPPPAIVESYRRALYNARIDHDKMRIALAKSEHRCGELEIENEALREMAALLAKSAGGAAL
jgi:hypothetical protein